MFLYYFSLPVNIYAFLPKKPFLAQLARELFVEDAMALFLPWLSASGAFGNSSARVYPAILTAGIAGCLGACAAVRCLAEKDFCGTGV